jgi:ribonuclease P protein component
LANQKLLKTSLVRKGWEYDKVYSRGKRLHGRGFALVYVSNLSGESRLGISVHRKIRGAVKRNRIKRIVRESFRLDREQYPAGADIVFAVRQNFFYSHPSDVSEAVNSLTCGITGLREA